MNTIIKKIRKLCVSINRKLILLIKIISPVIAIKCLYFLHTGVLLNLKNPKKYHEKIQWLNLFWNDEKVSRCADKVLVRDYVKECGCEEILTKLYGVYDNASQIDWEKLPDQFALKCNHGCGFNIVCTDKNNLNKAEASNKLNNWLKVKYGVHHLELHYNNIKPKIFCEEYIAKTVLNDSEYCLYCTDGKVRFFVISKLIESKKVSSYYDCDWNPIPVKKQANYDLWPEKPLCIEEMIRYAMILSKPFPFVRVDFYEGKKRPIFGEMTFIPAAAMSNNLKNEWQYTFGKYITLPAINTNPENGGERYDV